MGKQSHFMKKIQMATDDLIQQKADEVRRFTIQNFQDLAMLALHEEFGFGEDRLMRFAKALCTEYEWYTGEIENENKTVTNRTRKPEAEITMSHMDNRLKEILKDRFVPWNERY